MYLKSLELQGFKSFPDKIKLDFNKGITAVVGPNGSGKSNIGDAVRWVLGEQSSKSLRGGKMEDVIFAGTQERKSVGFAEVKLNIDNSNRDLAVDSDTVTISRKLYRSGDSEYLINGNQVRLKDIHESFMDTGLGKDGYSIIGQGKVADIVSSKSGERREIFEEAAGISKLRYKKAEAERNLANAEDNMVRLRDIIGELESRVEPLRIQSEKAAKFIELSENKKNLEISIWANKINTLEESFKQISDKILVASNEFNMFEADLARIDDEIDEIFQRKQECTIKIENARNEILDIERSNSKAFSEIAVCENDIEHLNSAINELLSQIEKSSLSKETYDNEILSLKLKISEISDLQLDIQNQIDTKTKIFQENMVENSSIDKKYAELNSKLNELYIRKSELIYEIKSSELSIVSSNAELSEINENQDEILSALKSSEDDKKELTTAISKANDELLSTKNMIIGYEKIFNNKKAQLNEMLSKNQLLKEKIMELKNKSTILNDLEKNMEGYSRSVKEIVKAQQTSRIIGIHGSIAQLISVEKKYSVAIEVALGASIQNIVVDNEDTAKRCISLLKELNAGRATFLPITSIKGFTINEPKLNECEGFIAIASDLVKFDDKYSGIIKSSLGRTVIAEDIDLATLIAKKFLYKFRVVTLDGQIINAGGSFTGGSIAKSAGVLSRQNEIKSLNSEISRISEIVSNQTEQSNILQNETNKMKIEIEALKDKFTEINTDIVRFEGDLKHNQTMITQISERINNSEKVTFTLNTKIEELKARIVHLNEQLQTQEDEISLTTKNLEQAQENIESLKSRSESFSSDINNLKVKLAELSKDKENYEHQIIQIMGISKNDLNEVNMKKATIIEHENTIMGKKNRIQDLKKNLENIDESFARINSQITALQVRNNELEISSNEKYNLQKKMQDEKINLTRKLTQLEERKLTQQSAFDDILSQLWEQYEMTKTDALSFSDKVNDISESQRLLNEVKSKIRSLGSINVEAIDEFKEVSERFEYMSKQLNDVEKSKNELENLISDLTETMREMFTKSFHEINENFKSIFVELFGGGKAELTLTDPRNILESGIEINVAPPGKVIKSLSLLSGGEQSFVAIAIYFSILKLKPSPFCILDEIEAALDDVNVTKYASYLRNFTDTTQFILITHRRGTMELADVLYGVTMQKKGISKILRMDVNSPEILED